MLVVNIELHSATTGKKSTVGTMVISNAGVREDGAKGDYRVFVGHKANAGDTRATIQAPIRRGLVRNHARLRENVWRLVSKALAVAFPETKVRPFDLYEDAVHGVANRHPITELTPETHRRVYLAGPMKGFPEHNYPTFTRVATILRRLGHEVYSPAEFKPEHASEAYETFPFRHAFARYAAYITTQADAIVMLPGWEHSNGATTEAMLAGNCGIPLFEIGDLP